MKVIHSAQCITWSPATIELRDPAIWGPERSIKFAYPDKNGNTARSSPEMPVHPWPQMTDIIVNVGGQFASEIAAVLPSDAMLRELEARMFAKKLDPKLVAGILFHAL